jgi:NhaP-type Na+/H+ or K+/H+ antiporter
VLASAVTVSDAGDHDRMRYGLSGEAGLNDGMAAPFVVLGIAWHEHGGTGEWLGGWAVRELLWGIPAALALGYVLGIGVGRVAIKLRVHQKDAGAPSDLLALALMGITYAAADTAGTQPFLAVFAAGLGLRAAEVHVVHSSPHPDVDLDADEPRKGRPHPPAEDLVGARVGPDQLHEPAIAAGVLVSETLSFGDTIERLVEVGLLVVIGSVLVEHWDARAIPLALALFVVIRPLATWIGLVRSPTSRSQRLLMGWFGLRGIGSLYYLALALDHQLALALHVTGLTISVIALSVVVHGISATPLLARYERSLEDATPAAAT